MIQTHVEAEPVPMPASPESRRIPLETKVVLKFNHFGGFFIEYSDNLSQTGVFIRTDAPRAPGSVFIFEIWLGDEFKLVHGIGEVVWTREQADGDGRPAGMGVRYLKLGGESREIIGRVIAEHVAKGGQVFDLWTEGDAEPPAGADAEAAAAAAEAATELDDAESAVSEAPTEEIFLLPTDAAPPVVEPDVARQAEPEPAAETAEAAGSDGESLLEMPDLGLDAGVAEEGAPAGAGVAPSAGASAAPAQPLLGARAAGRRRQRAAWLGVLILLAAAAVGAYLLF